MTFTSNNLLKIGLSSLKILLALFFMAVGGMKLAGAPRMVEIFSAIGIGQWLCYTTGMVEIGGGAALLVPSLVPLAAVLLASTMVGAALAHLFVLPGSPILAFVLLVLCGAVVWTGRHQITAHGNRYLRKYQ